MSTRPDVRARDCPVCGRPTEIEDEICCCFWCGWDEAPRCRHGVIEWEFCSQCPDGGV